MSSLGKTCSESFIFFRHLNDLQIPSNISTRVISGFRSSASLQRGNLPTLIQISDFGTERKSLYFFSSFFHLMLWLDGALSSVQEDVSVKINLFASFKNVLKCTSVQRQNNVYHEISSNASILFLFYMHLYILHVFLWCRCYVYTARHYWNVFSDKFNRFCYLKHGS